MGALKKALLLTTALTVLTSAAFAADCDSSNPSPECTNLTTRPIQNKPDANGYFIGGRYALTSSHSFYKGGVSSTLSIGPAGENDIPNFTFSGGKIWDFESYITEKTEDNATLSQYNIDGTLITPVFVDQVREGEGDFSISNGLFSDTDQGGIQIYKGAIQTGVTSRYVDDKGETHTQDLKLHSTGNLTIHYGTFNFLHNNGAILIYNNGLGSVFVKDGVFNVGSAGTAITAVIGGVGEQELAISGGKFNIQEGNTLLLTGKNITYEQGGDNKKLEFDENTTGTISFHASSAEQGNSKIEIKSLLNFEKGTLNFSAGNMKISDEVIVGTFTFKTHPLDLINFTNTRLGTISDHSLEIASGATLSVKKDFVMEAGSSLSGAGKLQLLEGANATFQQLNFGTVDVKGTGNPGEGKVEFLGAPSSLQSLIVEKGTANVMVPVSISSVQLSQDSTMNLNATLAAGTLSLLDTSKINFNNNQAVLKMTQEATIKNTANFVVADGVSEGILEASGSGTAMTFEDDENNHTQKFSVSKLSVTADRGVTLNFNVSEGVELNKLNVTHSTANFNQGTSKFTHITLGNSAAGENSVGILKIADGVNLKAGILQTFLGSNVEIGAGGTLTVQSGEIGGTESVWTKVSGTGTLEILGESFPNNNSPYNNFTAGRVTFNGQFNNFGTVKINASAIDATLEYAGLLSHGRTDVISELVFTGTEKSTLKIGNGASTGVVLQIKGLHFENDSDGSVDITKGAVLALDAGGGNANELVTGSGSIGGQGSVRLLGNTNLNFSGGDGGYFKYLGGLEIDTGTATITNGSTTLGSINFVGNTGKLQIDNGATLKLSDENGTACTIGSCNIVMKGGNKITGGGNLTFVDGDGSVFAGQIDIGTMTLGRHNNAAVTVTFNNSASDGDNISRVNTLTTDGTYGANIVIDTGKLLVTDNFGNNKTNIYGTGTLSLQGNGAFKNGSSQSLAKLEIGTGTVTSYGANLKDVAFTGNTGGTFVIAGNTTVTGNIATGSNTVSGASSLILDGSAAVGTFGNDLSGLTGLTVKNGATMKVASDMKVGSSASGLTLGTDAKLNIGQGSILTVSGALGADATSVISGDGTLKIGNSQVKSRFNNLTDLTSTGTGTTVYANNIIKNVNVESGTLNFNGGTISEKAVIAGTLNIAGNTSVKNVVFGDTSGTLNIAADKELTVTNNITVGGSNTLSGSGTLILNGSGEFGKGFAGTLAVGTGKATIKTDDSFGTIRFVDGRGGVLEIETGKTLSVGTITTSGNNRITGSGTLKLTGAGSDFQAPIDALGMLKMNSSSGQASATFHRNINIDTIKFENGGSIALTDDMTMTVNNMTQETGTGHISGAGTLVAGNGGGTVNLSTGGEMLNNVVVGSGTLNIVGAAEIGALTYSSATGTVSIDTGTTLTVSSFSGGGKLQSGGSSAQLNLTGTSNTVFNYAGGYSGGIKAESGSLTFLSSMNFNKLDLVAAHAKFERETNLSSLQVKDGSAEFKWGNTDISTLSVTGTGAVTFKGSATVGSLAVGAGTVFFEKDSSITTGSVSGGTLNVDVNTLTINTGNFTFNDSSNFALRIARTATEEQDDGTIRVQDTGYGRIKMNGGTLAIKNNVKMNLIIDYGLKTDKNGSVFKIVDGSVNSVTGQNFLFTNNRYSMEEEHECSGGICYRLKQKSTGSEAAEKENASNNQINVAGAFLDGKIFDDKTKAFVVAERLDALSQDSGKTKEFLNALTAVAPDVSGAMNRQPVALQGKIATALSGRMNGLMGAMGNSSGTYKAIQTMYGRSGGSPYRSRFMRSDDYYRRAGYYDQDDQPVTRTRPSYYRKNTRPAEIREEADVTAERRRWTKKKTKTVQSKDFGVWAQGFYNTSEYLSANKPDGFSGDTTGIAFGADVQVLDVVALGLGYASTNSTVDSLQRSTDVKGSSFFLYGMYKPTDWFVSSVLNMTAMDYQESKDIAGVRISDKYKGASFGASVMIGKDLKEWTPAVGVRYVTAKRDAHKDEIGQEISSVSSDVLTLVAESRFSREFGKTDNSVWHSEFSGALTYDVTTAKEDAAVKLPNDSTYTVAGEEFKPLGVELGASLAYQWRQHVDVSAEYNLGWRPDFLSHTVTAVFRYSF